MIRQPRANKSIRVDVTQGLRGWFAVVVDDEGPIRTGIGSYRTREQAIQEARDMAALDDLPLAQHLKSASGGSGQSQKGKTT
jgi:hypothetical protein